MAELIYTLCMLTSLACAWLLLGSYRRTGHRLLFWSCLCFAGMTVNNFLLMLDKLVFQAVDLLPYRLITALIAVCRDLVDWIRRYRRPAFLHLRTVRFLAHAGTDVELGFVPPGHVVSLSVAQLRALSPDLVPTVIPAQVRSLSVEQIPALTPHMTYRGITC